GDRPGDSGRMADPCAARLTGCRGLVDSRDVDFAGRLRSLDPPDRHLIERSLHRSPAILEAMRGGSQGDTRSSAPPRPALAAFCITPPSRPSRSDGGWP